MARKKENLKPKDLEKEEGPYQLVLVGKGTPRVVTSDWCDKNESSIEAYIGQFERRELADLAARCFIDQNSTEQFKKMNQLVEKLKIDHAEIDSSLQQAVEGIDKNLKPAPSLPMTPVMTKSRYNDLLDALHSSKNKETLTSQIRKSFDGDADPTIRKLYESLFGPRVLKMIFNKTIMIQISPIYEIIKVIGTEIFGGDETLFVTREKEFFIRNKSK